MAPHMAATVLGSPAVLVSLVVFPVFCFSVDVPRELVTTTQTYAGWPLMTAPQLVRDVSVASIMRRQGAPAWPWSCKVDFLLGRTPWSWATTVRDLLYSKPKYILLDAAAVRPSSYWNCLTVSEQPSLTLATGVRIDSIRAGDRCACIMVESHTTPR